MKLRELIEDLRHFEELYGGDLECVIVVKRACDLLNGKYDIDDTKIVTNEHHNAVGITFNGV